MLILELINEYVAIAKRSCDALRGLYEGNDSLLRAKQAGILLKAGRVNDFHYNFHGRGCCFTYKDAVVDLDFGPEGRCDVFDKYRLGILIESKPKKYVDLLDEKKLSQQFELLISDGIIAQCNEETYYDQYGLVSI